MEQNTKTILNHIPGGKDYRITANGRLVLRQYGTDQTQDKHPRHSDPQQQHQPQAGPSQDARFTQPTPPHPSLIHQAEAQSYAQDPAFAHPPLRMSPSFPTNPSFATSRHVQHTLFTQPPPRLSPIQQPTLSRPTSPVSDVVNNPSPNHMQAVPPTQQYIDQHPAFSNVSPNMQAAPTGSMAMHNQAPMQTY